ncbi:MAG: hypothetical protein HYV27_11280 [Candidatus Hydrogenedentes bacterium]|nr:hypothetical protein [Candidatus Hydrogenedentota bacterium]
MKCCFFLSAVLLPLLFAAYSSEAGESSVTVGAFAQQVHVPFAAAAGAAPDGVLAIAYTPEGGAYAGTAQGLARFSEGKWQRMGIAGAGPVAVMAGCEQGVYFSAQGRLMRVHEGVVENLGDVSKLEITAMATEGDGARLWIGTAAGLYHYAKGRLAPEKALNALIQGAGPVRGVAVRGEEVAAAMSTGLYVGRGGNWDLVLPGGEGERWAPQDVRGVAYDAAGRLWFACPQGVGCRETSGWTLYTGATGLPYNDFTCVRAGADGSVWLGTPKGAIRFVAGTWEFRESQRWLVHNEVRDIAVTPEGHAWFATAGGISCIESRPMTLAEKAAFYEEEIDRYHKRTPYGYVVNASLERPGDKGTASAPATDNDGQYTGLYAGAECLAYGATRDPRFKERATAAFEALAYLSEVTQGGAHGAPKGFIARSIAPADGPDPNAQDTPERDREKQQGDKLWKAIAPRWPVSADGKWYWKSDASSDELDGHYFAYGLYYDLVAETEEEKERCREVVRRVTKHLLRHDYRLVDHDGAPTRWARFSPEDLNEDPDWWAERGLNSLSMLTYLSVAHHVTGEAKYRKAYMKLVETHHYALNGMVMPKHQAGPGSFVQFDDKMAFMNFYHLLRYETDPELLRMYQTAIYHYWGIEKYELNPFFNFVYAACCLGKVRTDQWGDLDLRPAWPWLEQGVDTLKRFPLDLVAWPVLNSHRIDLAPLPDHVREPGLSEGTGFRNNGLVIPIDERQGLSWSEDVWRLDGAGDGTRLRDGAPYLLAYYMGRYHGFIKE